MLGLNPMLPERDKTGFPLVLDNRRTLAEWFAELGFTKGAEIGVYRGSNAATLLKHIPDLELWLVDAWATYEDYTNSTDGLNEVSPEEFEEIYQEAKDVVSNTPGVYSVHILRGMSMEALNCIKDESLDFVCIDANHDYDYVLADLNGWSKKVRKGGIISGHDYVLDGVSNAVKTFLMSTGYTHWGILTDDSQGYYILKQ